MNKKTLLDAHERVRAIYMYMANKTLHSPVSNLFGFGAIIMIAAVLLFFVLQMVMNKDESLDTRSQAGTEQRLKGDNLKNALMMELNNDKDVPVGGEEE